MATARRRVPVWVHQVVAYVAGAIIVGFAAHAPSADSALLLAGAAVAFALGLLMKGPLGPFRLLGPGSLRVGEVLAVVVLAVLPFAQAGGPRIEVVVTLWVAAVALLRLALFPGGAPVGDRGPQPVGTATPGAAPPASGPSALDIAVRQAGRSTGEAGRRVRDVGRQAQPAMLRGARALGRVAGRRQAGRRQVDRHDDTA